MANQSLNFIILDGRPIFKYDKEHIDASYSIAFPYILAKRIATKPEKFVEYILNDEAVRMIKKITEEKKGNIFYLIDNDFSEVLRKSLEDYYKVLITFVLYDDYKEQHTDVKLVKTTFNQIYPIISPPVHTPDRWFEMSEIIHGLYLGGEETAFNKELLKKNNVSTILNITSSIPFYYESEFTYHRIPIIDEPNVDIKQYFDETFKIIDDTLTENKKILIHCQAGISRSATIVIAYIMKKNKIEMNDAYKLVHTGRPCIGPNLGFCGQLMSYEQELML